MTDDDFFAEQKESSRVKSKIVSEYFTTWACIMLAVQRRTGRLGSERLGYIDLFSGPGEYDDGTKSTPLLVIESASQVPDLPENLQLVFNDREEKLIANLQNSLAELGDMKRFRHQPLFFNQEVGTELIAQLKDERLGPTLCFADPCGYKGLSLELFSEMIEGWGCDLIFFFNFNRIRAAINNPTVQDHVFAILGPERAMCLQKKLLDLAPAEQESEVIEEMHMALNEIGAKYVLPFRFKDERGTRTSHHLIFILKDRLAYEKMKELMHSQSSDANQGVANFEYNPATKRQQLLFELTRPLDDLRKLLQRDFASMSITIEDIYELHSLGRPYLMKHYREVVLALAQEGIVQLKRNGQAIDAKRRKKLFKDTVVKFQ